MVLGEDVVFSTASSKKQPMKSGWQQPALLLQLPTNEEEQG
jgi:hypothetical protein